SHLELRNADRGLRNKHLEVRELKNPNWVFNREMYFESVRSGNGSTSGHGLMSNGKNTRTIPRCGRLVVITKTRWLDTSNCCAVRLRRPEVSGQRSQVR